MSESRIIFHYPLPIVEGGASGGQMRPAHMLSAFRELGYHVDVVAGYALERQAAIRYIMHQQAAGANYLFAYAETINKPLLLAERLHLNDPAFNNRDYLLTLFQHNPWQDVHFFHWLTQREIPLGLFCRDVYWQFFYTQQNLSWFQRHFHRALYLYDWRRFRETVDHLFLPHLAMQELLPQQWDLQTVSPLPPGVVLHEASLHPTSNQTLQLFYVGGIVPPRYDLKDGLMQVAQVPEVTMTLCCRPSEWRAWVNYYQLPRKIDVIHASGAALAAHYQSADLFYMVRQPVDYWQYTIPIKIFEALGYGLPIVLLAGTPAADFVAQHDIGWVLQSADELGSLLTRLHQNRDLLAQKRSNMMRIREDHTWQQRAQTAAAKLQR